MPRRARLRALFFDAGNTLLFASLDRTLAPLYARGLHPSQEQLYASERAAKRHLDAQVAHGGSVDQSYWSLYYGHLLGLLSCDNDPALLSALVTEVRKGVNWQEVKPGTREALQRLKMRFRLGVISNSDGTVQRAFDAVGLTDCFDSFTDSGIVGCEKPDPRIFRAAMASLESSPEESAYIGDVYSVDFVGAASVGMRAVLMDAAGAYRDLDVPRAESLAEVESLIGRIGHPAPVRER